MKKKALYYVALTSLSAMIPLGVTGSYALFTGSASSQTANFAAGTVGVNLQTPSCAPNAFESELPESSQNDKSSQRPLLAGHMDGIRLNNGMRFANPQFLLLSNMAVYEVTNSGSVNEWVSLDYEYQYDSASIKDQLTGNYYILTENQATSSPSASEIDGLAQDLKDHYNSCQQAAAERFSNAPNQQATQCKQNFGDWLQNCLSNPNAHENFQWCRSLADQSGNQRSQFTEDVYQQWLSHCNIDFSQGMGEQHDIDWTDCAKKLIDDAGNMGLRYCQSGYQAQGTSDCNVNEGRMHFAPWTGTNSLPDSDRPFPLDSPFGSWGTSTFPANGQIGRTDWFELKPGQAAYVLYSLYTRNSLNPPCQAPQGQFTTWANAVQHENGPANLNVTAKGE
jgi:hypothetical protein